MRDRQTETAGRGSWTALAAAPRRAMNSGAALLWAYAFLALGMFKRYGTYAPIALVFLLASFACTTAALAWARREKGGAQPLPSRAAFAIVLALLLLVAWRKPAAFFTASAAPLLDAAHHVWLVVLAILIPIAHISPVRKNASFRRGVFLVAAVVALAFRIWLPLAVSSSSLRVDTFTSNQESARNLLEGKNPYHTPLSDVEEGARHFGYTLRAYTYLPANLYFYTAAYWATGDVRYANVFAEAAVLLILWLIAKRHWEEGAAELICLLFLYHPSSLFIIEQCFTEPLILLLMALFLLLRLWGRDSLACVAYGCLLSLKQYLLFFFLQWFLIERRWRLVLLGMLAGALSAAPFLIADCASFLREGLLYGLHIPFRADSLTIFGFLRQTLGVLPPPAWSFLVGALFTAATWIAVQPLAKLRAYLFAVAITTFGTFLFGSRAFGNYYYLVSGLLLFLIAIEGRSAEARPA